MPDDSARRLDHLSREELTTLGPTELLEAKRNLDAAIASRRRRIEEEERLGVLDGHALRRALSGLKAMGVKSQWMQARLGNMRRERAESNREARTTWERAFVQAARSILDEETWTTIVAATDAACKEKQ